MSTKRTPIRRTPANRPITPRMARLHVDMEVLRCTCPPPKTGVRADLCPGCKRWYAAQAELHTAFGCKPWEWPCVVRRAAGMAGSDGTPASDADGKITAARMQRLDEAAVAYGLRPPEKNPVTP